MKFLLLFASGIGLFALDPAAFQARKAGVRTLLEQQKFGPALEQARALNRDWPDDLEGYRFIGTAQLALGDYTAAEQAIQKMLDLRIGKADSEGWLLVAQFREVTGDIDGALEAVDLAYRRLAPGQESLGRAFLVYAGRLHYIAGRLAVAERAVQDLTGEPGALETLARVRLAQGRRDDAIRILRGLVKQREDPRWLFLIATATGTDPDYEAFERAARRGGANRELALYLAGPGKRPAEALEVARRDFAGRKDVFTLDAMAVALSASGRQAEARAAIRQALAAGTRDPEILAHASTMGVKPE